MKTWLDPQPVYVPMPIAEAVGGHALVAEILVRRGFADLESIQAFLDPERYVPASPYELDDMQLAVDRIITALHEKQKIFVWGDFDVDGQTATALLVSTLQELGGVVDYHIPLRNKESHGVNLPVLKEKIAGGIDLLLTCDTGVGDHQPLEYAASQGVDVIITDHHDLPEKLPQVLAVVNPKRGAPGGPLAGLPGVGVAYELAQALFERLGNPNGAEKHLDLVALGIVADLATQTGDVRYLLQRGLDKLRQTERLGLQVMLEIAGISPAGITEEHIGFELGPRLNALGRLGDANQAVEFFTTGDKSQARLIANQLEGLNNQRKLVTRQVFQAAQAQIEAEPKLLGESALVLSQASWPGGVIGIVASRLVERYNKPVLLISSPPGELARGSARSVPGVDISTAIAAQRDLLEGYGGHPMAAGFSLHLERIPEFRQALCKTVGEMISEVSYVPGLDIDHDLPLGDLTLEMVTDLERLAPFGPGNPNLVFASRELRYLGSRSLGRSGDHLLVRVEDQAGSEYQALWWGGGIEPLPEWLEAGAAFDLAYTARSRDYRGQKEIQVEWQDAHQVETEEIEITGERSQIEVVDHRQASHPLMKLSQILSLDEDCMIWAEAGAKERLAERGIQARDRYSLLPARRLVVWTAPPDPGVLNQAVEEVSPEIVHLFAVDPNLDQVKEFVERLLGLAKFALGKTRGQVKVFSLAAATAQRERAVWLGLHWLAAHGYLAVQDEGEGVVCFGEGTGERDTRAAALTEQLGDLLAETSAYRRHYAIAGTGVLIQRSS